MASRSLILNDQSVFTYYENPSANGEIQFKRASIDGTDTFGKTDLRISGPNDDEHIIGATVMGNGNLRLFYTTTQNGGNNQLWYSDFDTSTGALIGAETAASIVYTFPDGVTTFEFEPFGNTARTQDLLTRSDGSIVFERYGTAYVWTADGTLTYAGGVADYPHTSTVQQVGDKLLIVKGDIQAAINGNPATNGVTTAELFSFGPDVTLIQDAALTVDEGDHSINANFGLGLNGIDAVELNDGRFVIAYSDKLIVNQQVTDDEQSIWLKIYNADGTVDRSEYLGSTNADDGDTVDPVLYALYDGGFALAFNTRASLPQIDRHEVRIFDETGDQRDGYVIQETSLDFSDDIYVSPDGAVWVYTDEVTIKEHQFTVEGGPAPEGIVLNGSLGSDSLEGTAYDDMISGRNGNDTIDGFDGDDVLAGGNGDDTLYGGDGRDVIRGGNDKDTIYGDEGADRLLGLSRPDTIYGGTGRDVIKGGSGGDTIYGEAGNDRLLGGLGADVFVFARGDGSDLVRDFAIGDDMIAITSGASTFADLTISANNGDALVTFSDVQITLQGIDFSNLTSDYFDFGL